jgi:hypothetical protein
MRMRARRAILFLAKNARHSHGVPRSLDRQKVAARDDKAKLLRCSTLKSAIYNLKSGTLLLAYARLLDRR